MENKIEQKLAVIRVRGLTGVRDKTKYTLEILRLYKSNYCSILTSNPVNLGMLKKAKDYITWGEIDDDTFKELIKKRAEEFSGRETDSKKKIKYDDFLVVDNKKIKKFFRLNPPRKGFGTRGVKHGFNEGGALGYRGKAINELLRKML